MKFTVSQSALSDAIAVVMKGIAPSSTLPILSGVLVRAADGVLEFQTSNYTISIRHRIAARVDEEGHVPFSREGEIEVAKSIEHPASSRPCRMPRCPSSWPSAR